MSINPAALDQPSQFDPSTIQPKIGGPSDFVDLWLARRLSGMEKANGPRLSAGLKFDLSTGLDDDIAQSLSDTGAIPPQRKPSAFSDLISHGFSSAVPTTPVTDITQFQQKLQAQGYLPPDYAPSGAWDSLTSSAARRFSDDQAEQVREGNGKVNAISTHNALELLNATLPSHVWSGVVGAVKGVGKSFWGTLKRIGGIFTSLLPGGQTPTQALADVWHHLGEDGLNVLTAAGMVVGVGELVDAGRAALGVAGMLGEDGAAAAAKLGYSEAAGNFFAKPAEDVLLNQNKSLVLKAAQRVSSTFMGTQRADGFADFILKYGPRAQAERPVLRLAGQAYGGLSKAAFFPNAAAILEPNTALGKSVRSVKPLPWYADLPTIVVHPQNGSIPGVKQMAKVFHVADLGAIDPLHGYFQGGVSNDVRSAIYVGAYQRAQAAEALHSLPNWEDIRKEGGAVLKRAEKQLLQAEADKALVDPLAADRSIKPEVQQAAQEYGTQQPWAVRAYMREVFTSAQYRESMGLRGLSTPEQYQEAENIGREIQRKVSPQLPEFQRQTAALSGARDDLRTLVTGWQGDEETANHIKALKAHVTTLQDNLQSKVPVDDLPVLHAIDNTGAIATHSAEAQTIHGQMLDAQQSARGLKAQQAQLSREWRYYNDINEKAGTPGSKIAPDVAQSAASKLDQLHNQLMDIQDQMDSTKQNISDLAGQHAESRGHVQRLTKEQAASEAAATASEKAAAEHGIPTDKRILVMRADNPATKENIQQLLDAWNQGDDVARAGLQPKLRELGLDTIDPGQVPKHLRIMRNDAPTDITGVLPAEHQNRLAELGYKAVAGGHQIVQWNDVAPWIGNVPNYSKFGYFWANLGLSSVAQDPRDIQRYAYMASKEAVDTTLHSYNPDMFPRGSGQSLLTSIAKDNGRITGALADTAKEGATQRFLARAQSGFRGYDDFNVPKLERLLKGPDFNVPEADAAMLARNIHGSVLNAHAYMDYLKTPGETFTVLHKLAAAMRIHGLAGVSEALRAMTISDIAQATPFAKSADKWGFLPEKLMRSALAMRFQLNPMFEARLMAKNQVFRATEEELTPVLRARKWLEAQGASTAANNVFSRVHGWDPAAADDAERAVLQGGLFGYNREANAKLDSWRLYEREYAKAGGTADELSSFKSGDIGALNQTADKTAISYIRQNGMKLFGYGDRSPLEKSINMIFFPFSFEKKLVGSVADYLTAQPVRTMLVHAWAKQIDHMEQMDEFHRQQLSTTINRYAPLFKEVRALNAFAHGIGVGEFGGVYKPLATALKVPVDALIGAFHPFGATKATLPSFNQIRDRVLPGYKAVQGIVQDSMEQVRLGQQMLHKDNPDQQVESVSSQIDDYFTLRRSAEEQFTSMAPIFGVQPDIVTFMRSTRIPEYLKEEWLGAQATLARQYPDGAKKWASYSASSTEQDLAKLQVLSKVNKTRAEQGIVAIEAMRLQLAESPVAQSGSSIATLLQSQIDFETVRGQAIKLYQKIGPTFDQLWRSLGYAHTYGPLSVQDSGAEQQVGAA